MKGSQVVPGTWEVRLPHLSGRQHRAAAWAELGLAPQGAGDDWLEVSKALKDEGSSKGAFIFILCVLFVSVFCLHTVHAF